MAEHISVSQHLKVCWAGSHDQRLGLQPHRQGQASLFAHTRRLGLCAVLLPLRAISNPKSLTVSCVSRRSHP